MRKASVRVLILLINLLQLVSLFASGSPRTVEGGQALFPELEKMVKNFSYRLAAGPEEYKLENGQYEGGRLHEDYISLRLEGAAYGDLNQDGKPDAAVILVANYGGSGCFYELTVLLSGKDGWRQSNNLELGDRIQVKNMSVKQGQIILDCLIHGPDDPMCCPSKRVVKRFGLLNGVLEEFK